MSEADFGVDGGGLTELEEFNSRVGSSPVNSGRARGYASEDPEDSDEDDKAKKAKDASMWAKQGVSYFPCDEAVDKLAPGQYEILSSQSQGIYFKMSNSKFDELIELPDSASEAVIAEIQKFWTKEEHFRKFGFLWKRGILLWGPPGSGKTCCLQQVSNNIIEAGGIAVYGGHPGITAAGLSIMRRIEPDRPIVVMMEDLDALVQQYGEADILALLDGELQIDNVVFIATTNYPERLDKRIVNRPSRFDLVRLIDMPNEAARRVYLSVKNTRLVEATVECKPCGGTGGTAAKPCDLCKGTGGTSELDAWIKGTERYSIAHLKELIVSVEVFEVKLEFALKRLGQMLDSVPKSTDTLKPSGQYS